VARAVFVCWDGPKLVEKGNINRKAHGKSQMGRVTTVWNHIDTHNVPIVSGDKLIKSEKKVMFRKTGNKPSLDNFQSFPRARVML
jgi:hypothetical protein